MIKIDFFFFFPFHRWLLILNMPETCMNCTGRSTIMRSLLDGQCIFPTYFLLLTHCFQCQSFYQTKQATFLSTHEKNLTCYKLFAFFFFPIINFYFYILNVITSCLLLSYSLCHTCVPLLKYQIYQHYIHRIIF